MVVCDGGCLERNLNLVLQVRVIVPRVLVCVNLLDETACKGIRVDLDALSQQFQTPVIGVVARRRESRRAILMALDDLINRPLTELFNLPAPPEAEAGLERLEAAIQSAVPEVAARWLALQLLEGDDVGSVPSEIENLAVREQNSLEEIGLSPDGLKDAAVSDLVMKAAEIAQETVTAAPCAAKERDLKIDRVLTGDP